MDRRGLAGQPDQGNQRERAVVGDVQQVLAVRRRVTDALVGPEQLRVTERRAEGTGDGVDRGPARGGAAHRAVEVGRRGR